MDHQSIILITSKPAVWEVLIQKIDQLQGLDFQPPHPDIFILQPEADANSIGVEETRKVTDWASKRPFEKHIKIAVILLAHKLTEEAQNSLLKLIEEPMPDTLIIINTHSLDSLLATIRSRSLLVSAHQESELHQITESAVAQFLGKQTYAERLKSLEEFTQSMSDINEREVLKLFVERLISTVIHMNSVNPTPEWKSRVNWLTKIHEGLSSSTNIKLTLQSLAITMY